MTQLGELTQVGGDSTVPYRAPSRNSRHLLPAWAVLVASAVAFWVVGFLPWIVEGMHLQVSSAWPRFDTILGPVVALPFNEYAFTALFVSSVIGGTAALAVSRLAASDVAHPRLVASGGAAIALVTSLAQTFFTVRPALADTDEARLLVGALIVAVLGSGVFGILVGAGVARGRGWRWLLGGAVAASLVGLWFIDVIARNPAGDPGWVMRAAQWHPWISGIALGAVLAIFGFLPATRTVGWLVALAIAWVLPSALTAANYVTYYASRGPLRRSQITEVVDAGRDVFLQSLSPDNHHVGPLVLAVAVGAAGAVWRLNRSMARPRPAADAG